MALHEASLETTFRKSVKKMGGKAIKFSLLSHWPDRMCLFPGGRLLWVELKAPGKKPRKGQAAVHAWLRKMGFQVDVISTREELKEWLEKL